MTTKTDYQPWYCEGNYGDIQLSWCLTVLESRCRQWQHQLRSIHRHLGYMLTECAAEQQEWWPLMRELVTNERSVQPKPYQNFRLRDVALVCAQLRWQKYRHHNTLNVGLKRNTFIWSTCKVTYARTHAAAMVYGAAMEMIFSSLFSRLHSWTKMRTFCPGIEALRSRHERHRTPLMIHEWLNSRSRHTLMRSSNASFWYACKLLLTASWRA